MLLGIAPNSATFLRAVSAPSLESTGSLLCSSSAVIGGPLYVGGTDVMTAIANAGSAIGASSQLAVASVTCTGDVTARDLVATGELHADGATVLNGTLTVGGANVMSAIAAKQAAFAASAALSLSSVTASNGMVITGGRGGVSTAGAVRQLASPGGIMPAPPGLFFGVNGEDHHVWEYNYLGFAHFWRTSAANAWSESARVTTNNKWNF